jgi:hypothetical protein
MDVFVIPLGVGKYALYCEPGASAVSDVEADAADRGIFAKIRRSFARLVRMAEERQHRHTVEIGRRPRWIAHGQDVVFGWVAKKIAEQRLLWNLRTATAAVVVHPHDMTFDQVMVLVRRILDHDYRRHRLWTWLDGAMFAITGVLLGPFFLLIPGIANIPAMYFGFRAVGHWFSMRGATNGLRAVSWSGRPCPSLGELRELGALEPGARAARIHDVAARLRLAHLSAFVESVSLRHA